MTMSDLKTKTTLVRIENEGCQIQFLSSPNLTIVVPPNCAPKNGNDNLTCVKNCDLNLTVTNLYVSSVCRSIG